MFLGLRSETGQSIAKGLENEKKSAERVSKYVKWNTETISSAADDSLIETLRNYNWFGNMDVSSCPNSLLER